MNLLATALLFTLAVPSPAVQGVDAFQMGLIALQQNRPADALEQFTRAEQANPVDARIRTFRGLALAQMGRDDEAAAEYRDAIRLAPKSADAYRDLGHLEWMRNRPDEARRALHVALALTPNDPFANYYLGRIELDSRDYPEAAAHLEHCSSLWPVAPDFCYDLARAYLSLHRPADSRRVLARVQNLRLTDEQSVQCGALLLAVHDNAGGVEVFRRMKRAHPDASWTVFNLALAQLWAGEPLDALATVQSVVTPQGPATAWTLIGIAAAETQDHERSIAAFGMAARLASDQEERWLDLTRELMARERYPEAVTDERDWPCAGPAAGDGAGSGGPGS